MKYTHEASKRKHNVAWILFQTVDLLQKAVRLRDVSKVLYASLEARTLLEMISVSKLLCSVPAHERDELRGVMKPKNGIEKSNSKNKSLNLKLQEFMEVLSEVESFPASFPIFKFSECKDIQTRLSQYVHSYTRLESEVVFDSNYIQNGVTVINEAIEFAKLNLVDNSEKQTYYIINVEINSLPSWVSEILTDWKQEGKIKSRDELKSLINKATLR